VIGTTLAGNLRLQGKIAELPEGTLYRGRYPAGLEVIVLVLRRGRNDPTADDSIGLLDLQQELRQAAQIKHPNVAAVYELGQTPDGLPYAVMEQLAGELLSNILAVRGMVSVQEALDLCLQAAGGLQAAHDVGLVHGNLSASTILVTDVGGNARVKLIRFSDVSSLMEQQINRPFRTVLAADYASPERLRGNPPDQQSDVFSLAAVLHHLLTGAPPEGSRIGAVPRVFVPVLSQALDPSPVVRFQTMAEFARALEGAAAIAKRPRWQKANRPLGRGLAGVGLVIIMLALFWHPWTQRPQSTRAVAPTTVIPTRAPPVGSGEISRETGRPLVERESAVGPSDQPATQPAAARPPRAPVAVKQRAGSNARTTVGVAPASETPSAKEAKTPALGVPHNDSAPQPKMSPFRRSHPWAAAPGGRFYFRSSCSVALQSSELRYFKTAEEARAEGYIPSTAPGC